jgi:hypothetical protein
MPTFKGANPFAGTFVVPAHGRQAQLGQTFVVEVPPASALQPLPAAPAAPIPAPAQPRGAPFEAGSSAAVELGRKGGLARAAKANALKAISGLGLLGAAPSKLAPYLDAAEQWSKHEVERLAKDAGSGVVSPAVAALVQSAALALAGSRAAYAEGSLDLASKLAAASQRHTLAAFSLAVSEGKARAGSGEETLEQVLKRINAAPVEGA